MIKGDFHTHTIYSHGKNTVEEMVQAAHEKGLLQIGITDHGLRHVALGTTRQTLIEMRHIVDTLRNKYPDMEILLGVEANIYSSDGRIDLKPFDYDLLDYVCAGYHKGVWPKSIPDLFKYNLRGMFNRHSDKRDIKIFTRAAVKAISSGKIAFITHPTQSVDLDIEQVAQACLDYGVYAELNGKGINMRDEQILLLQEKGVSFIMNSDAHSRERVAEISVPMSVVDRLNLNKDKIVNWEKIVPIAKRR